MTQRRLTAIAATLLIGVICAASVPILTIHEHNHMADVLGSAVSLHATQELALSCQEPTRKIGTLLGAGGEECDVGVVITCAGVAPNGSFSIVVHPDETQIVDVKVDANRVVLTSFLDSLEPGWDPRCW